MMKRMDILFPRKDRLFHAFRAVLLLVFLLAAGSSSGQSDILGQKVTYKANKTTLSKVLKEIRSKTKVRFSYNSELVGRQQPITINVTAVPLRELLQQLLAGTNLAFTEEMGGIIIYEKKEERKTMAGKPDAEKLAVVVRGQVTDPAGTPLPGVSIRAMESREMTTTSDDGMFIIVANNRETISFSLMGMKNITYKAVPSSQNLLRFTMDTIVREIREVVINGYQKIDPRLATGSYTKLTGAQILEPGVASIDRMLQGKVPGLVVTNTSGSVNAKAKMRIRGTSTLVGNASPLVVVDGMIRPDPANISSAVLNNLISAQANANYEMMGNAISGVNPFDIESITFLRDAAATAIYGTRAANGVIVITTKRGKAGAVQVNYNANASFQARPSYRNMKLMNSKERVELSRQLEDDMTVSAPNYNGVNETISYEGLRYALYSREITEEQFIARVARLETINTDWFRELFRNSFGMQHNLNISGGSGKTTFYASLGYAANNGAAQMDGNKVYNGALNVRTEVGKRITVDLSLSSNMRNSTGYFNTLNPMTYAVQTTRSLDPGIFYPRSATEFEMSSWQNFLTNRGQPLMYNFKYETDHTNNTSKVRSTNMNLQLDYKVAKGLYFRNLSSIAMSNAEGFSSFDDRTYQAAFLRTWDYGVTPTSTAYANSTLQAGGIAYINSQQSLLWNIRNSLDYTRGLFKDRDQFNISVGNEVSSEKVDGYRAAEPGYFPDRGKTFYPTERSTQSHSRKNITDELNNIVSWYGTAAYSIMNRYIISGSMRADGSNRFGQYSNSRFLPAYAISARWNASAESWFPTSGVLSDFQLRASYGTQGNLVKEVGPSLIATYDLVSNSINPSTTVPYLRIKTLPYPDLRWEKTYQFSAGADVAFFNNRIRAGIEFYHKHTKDALDMVEIPYEYGRDAMYRNGSQLYNRGLEVMLNVDVIKKKDVLLSLSMMSSKNFNKKDDVLTKRDLRSLLNGTGHLAGRPVSGFYSFIYSGLSPVSGQPTFANMDLKESTFDPNAFLVYSGQLEPKITMSFNPSLQYKSFTLSAGLYVSLGSHKRLNVPFSNHFDDNGVPSSFTNLPTAYLDRWRKPGDEVYTDIPAFQDYTRGLNYVKVPYATGTASNSGTVNTIQVSPLFAYANSDYWTVSNDYLRCNKINLTYRIPAYLVKGAGIKYLATGFSVNNAFTIASKQLKGQDPEIDGVGTTALPLTRQYAFSVSATF